MRCSACNAPVGYKKKKPVTVFSGHMNSHYTDSINPADKIPKGEYEDLCDTCIGVIRYYNTDFSDHNIGEVQREAKEFYLESDSAYEDGSMAGDFEITEDFYQGYRKDGL